MDKCNVSILGENWSIEFRSQDADKNLIDNDGYTDSSLRLIVIDNMESCKDNPGCKGNLTIYQNKVLRHEIIHAFMAESGLDGNGNSCDCWELNEEMVDWFAIQAPKIFKVFKELNIM